jgi:hypothetical protein
MKNLITLILVLFAFVSNAQRTMFGSQNNYVAPTTPTLPVIVTTTVNTITGTTAISGGTVTSDGGEPVNSRGLVWGTSPGSLSFSTTSGSGMGVFSINLTTLSAATTYYVKAYATNSIGTSYGSELSFTTSAVAPTVTTTAITNISANSANSGGTVTSTGGAAITVQGVCWNTTGNPTTTNSNTTNGTTTPFTSNISGLAAGTTYYVRAYATNSAGTSYGSQVSFTTTASSALKLHYDTNNAASYPGSGTTLTDLSGNGNHGTLVNNSSFTTLAPTSGGGVLSFNGTNQYISTTYTPSNTCSISIWFNNNLNYSQFNRGIFSTYNNPNSTNGIYMATYSSTLNLSRDNNDGYFHNVLPSLSINTWYNVTVTSDPAGAGTIKVYLNGVLQTTITGKTTHADVLNIGRSRFDYNYWSGYIGSAMVYNTVLSNTDVLNNYNSQKTRFGY